MVVAAIAFAPASAGSREFTDTQGRKIEASIDSVRSPNVVLKRADGKSFVFPLAKLSKEDQEYVKKWRLDNPQISLNYRFEKEKVGSGGDKKRKFEDWCWKVTVTNRGLDEVTDLTFEYESFKQVNDRYATKKRRYVSGKVEGTAAISKIEATRSATFQTTAIRTGKVNSITTSGNTKTLEKWHETMVGIKVIVKRGGAVIDKREFGVIR